MLLPWGIAAYVHSMDLKDTFSYFPFSKSYQNGSKMRPGDLRSGVNNFFVNTIVTALQGSEWERLLEMSVDRNTASFSSISNYRPPQRCVNWPCRL